MLYDTNYNLTIELVEINQTNTMIFVRKQDNSKSQYFYNCIFDGALKTSLDDLEANE